MMLVPPPPLVPTPGLVWRRSFPGCPEEASAVRRFLRVLLPGDLVLDDLTLVVDELVVNAIRHTASGRPGGAFTVEVLRRDGSVAVSVHDQGGPSEPAAADLGAFAESGRGLRTVSALATRWGWFGNQDGRTVTAVFASAGPDEGAVTGTGDGGIPSPEFDLPARRPCAAVLQHDASPDPNRPLPGTVFAM